MTIGEKIELALIPAVSLAFLVVAPLLPMQTDLGSLLLFAAVALLTQSLLRDLWLLVSMRPDAAHQRAARCMCVETIVGSTGVIAAIILVGAGIRQPIDMPGWAWPFGVFAVGLLGYSIKDFVFEWNPWSIRRETDHVNILVRWKK